ncbi:MAG: hypothetical protein ACYS1A_19125 [Planctomycetota bacterium]|jgi:hypothetical protein
MANQTDGTPIVLDTAATIWTGEVRNIRLIQWIDDAGDLADTNTLVMTINASLVTQYMDMGTANERNDTVAWQAGPFNPGIPVSNLVLTTLDGGVVHIWID